MTAIIIHGNNLDILPTLDDCSIDSIVTDPPYELGFMGKKWDASGIAYNVTFWAECLRVLKPGGHLLAFGGTRTYHRMACAIEDAGFEIRDSIHWIYGSGFPKSLDVSKAIDKSAGAEREVVGTVRTNVGMQGGNFSAGSKNGEVDITAPATEQAKQWAGWGTALKPAHEPVVVARKPLVGTVAANVLEWGTGAINIDGARIAGEDTTTRHNFSSSSYMTGKIGEVQPIQGTYVTGSSAGRWPANVVLGHHQDCDHECVPGCPVALLDEQSGKLTSGANPTRRGADSNRTAFGEFAGQDDANPQRGKDSGGASRFFYCAKPSRRERNAGLNDLPERRNGKMMRRANNTSDEPSTGFERFDTSPAQNYHPTVKPLALMRYLVRLVTPPNGTVLDPFAGSGTTLMAAILEGFNPIGIEMTDEYLPIIEGRIAWAEQQAAKTPDQQEFDL